MYKAVLFPVMWYYRAEESYRLDETTIEALVHAVLDSHYYIFVLHPEVIRKIRCYDDLLIPNWRT